MEQHPAAESLLHRIKDPSVRAAFRRVDRARFVPNHLKASAWDDHPLPIEENATISQPSLVAEMTELLRIGPTHRILEIGTGSGYQTALLAELAKHVYTIEINSTLSAHARERLDSLNYRNIDFSIGDGSLGWPDAAPFDGIVATAAFESRPEQLLDQLKTGGICIAPVGSTWGIQWLIQYTNTNKGISEKNLFPVRFLCMK